MWLIDIKDKYVSQPEWLPGCPIKGHFTAKKANNNLKLPFKVQLF